MRTGSGYVSKRLGIVILCKRMKWSYTDYALNPHWFNDLMRVTLEEDSKHDERERRRQEQKAAWHSKT